uniref:Homing endonuclease LAGLIDADG domain-containing protein n=1 Tax=Beauveria caledonica TaxID=38006 RepID=A0A192S1J8_9HYPO|nr:hypothetical protein [Beauveria caledonica]AMD61810.1 hypothetical protein [Beauveria caledonica]
MQVIGLKWNLFNLYIHILYKLYNSKRFFSSNSSIDIFSNKYKKEHELTKEQHEAIIGIILGDGSLERGKYTYNTRLRMEHNYPLQKSYVSYVYNIFSSLIKSEPTIVIRKPHHLTGNVHKSIYVRTLRFSCLNKYHDLFYKDNKKIIPGNIEELITYRGLAHFIMGDGYYHNNDGVIFLCTENFSIEDQEVLIKALSSKLDIKATLNKRTATKSRIRISKSSMDKLVKNVESYFIPEMLYKLNK